MGRGHDFLNAGRSGQWDAPHDDARRAGERNPVPSQLADAGGSRAQPAVLDETQRALEGAEAEFGKARR